MQAFISQGRAKVVGVILIVLLALNLTLFSFRILSWQYFWGIIILCAVLAYFLPFLVKKQ